jgi:hypothetical protein
MSQVTLIAFFRESPLNQYTSPRIGGVILWIMKTRDNPKSSLGSGPKKVYTRR